MPIFCPHLLPWFEARQERLGTTRAGRRGKTGAWTSQFAAPRKTVVGPENHPVGGWDARSLRKLREQRPVADSEVRAP